MGGKRHSLGTGLTAPQTIGIRLGELETLVGAELGPSPWLEVDQERTDLFARATDDHQWLHTDAARAADGPFGQTIAHGLLTLALVIRFWSDLVEVEDAALTVNYGLNKVRFPAPVPTGSRIRASFRIEDVAAVDGGVQAVIGATVERADHPKPVCVAELVLRFLA